MVTLCQKDRRCVVGCPGGADNLGQCTGRRGVAGSVCRTLPGLGQREERERIVDRTEQHARALEGYRISVATKNKTGLTWRQLEYLVAAVTYEGLCGEPARNFSIVRFLMAMPDHSAYTLDRLEAARRNGYVTAVYRLLRLGYLHEVRRRNKCGSTHKVFAPTELGHAKVQELAGAGAAAVDTLGETIERATRGGRAA